jgi:hypothetical protein
MLSASATKAPQPTQPPTANRQDAFAADMRLADPAKVAVLLCGQKPMAEAVKEMVTAAGVPAEAILTNF